MNPLQMRGIKTHPLHQQLRPALGNAITTDATNFPTLNARAIRERRRRHIVVLGKGHVPRRRKTKAPYVDDIGHVPKLRGQPQLDGASTDLQHRVRPIPASGQPRRQLGGR